MSTLFNKEASKFLPVIPDKAHIKNRTMAKISDFKSSASGSSPTSKPVFVIQKHESKKLHYDLRLEIDGILKSWAIPNGLSVNPGEKSLAVPSDDHPIEYADFEGVIPKNKFGAGTIMVWDTGFYENLMIKDDRPVPILKCFKNGQIEVRLYGKRISGRYILIKSEKTEMEENWLLIRMDDNETNIGHYPANTEDVSILTGRTMSQISHDAQKNG